MLFYLIIPLHRTTLLPLLLFCQKKDALLDKKKQKNGRVILGFDKQEKMEYISAFVS